MRINRLILRCMMMNKLSTIAGLLTASSLCLMPLEGYAGCQEANAPVLIDNIIPTFSGKSCRCYCSNDNMAGLRYYSLARKQNISVKAVKECSSATDACIETNSASSTSNARASSSSNTPDTNCYAINPHTVGSKTCDYLDVSPALAGAEMVQIQNLGYKLTPSTEESIHCNSRPNVCNKADVLSLVSADSSTPAPLVDQQKKLNELSTRLNNLNATLMMNGQLSNNRELQQVLAGTKELLEDAKNNPESDQQSAIDAITVNLIKINELIYPAPRPNNIPPKAKSGS